MTPALIPVWILVALVAAQWLLVVAVFLLAWVGHRHRHH